MIKEMLGIREGILEDLHQDHEKVAAMIKQIIASEDAQERAQVFKEMSSDLLAHAHAESQVLYRKLEKSEDPDTRKFAFEGNNEHQIVENQINQLARARNKLSEEWTAQVTVLQELINHHVSEEESTGFSSAHKEFDREQLEKLGEQFRRQKEKLLTAG
ncbi:MAG: hemerythrin domain-containing protein [Alphaproteobacteria bacterium]|nr:hemerythrin domain-containing protein [Alphaproteobacteria bacterium]